MRGQDMEIARNSSGHILSTKDPIVTPYLRSKQMEYYIQTPKIRPTF
jgi:hypothetical protein